jgi:hypothetical protein
VNYALMGQSTLISHSTSVRHLNYLLNSETNDRKIAKMLSFTLSGIRKKRHSLSRIAVEWPVFKSPDDLDIPSPLNNFK